MARSCLGTKFVEAISILMKALSHKRPINYKCHYLFLKIVSASFASLLFSLNESACETRKNAFYFTSKALFVLEKIKF